MAQFTKALLFFHYLEQITIHSLPYPYMVSQKTMFICTEFKTFTNLRQMN